MACKIGINSPFVLLGCKAVIYKDGNTRGSWASRGIDGWYLGPSMDHYQCSLFYVPETRAYCISGSAELFPQHCQIPNMSPHQHLRALTDELRDTTAVAASTSKGRRLLKLLQSNLQTILNPPALTATPRTEQRVTKEQQRVREEEQRVINDTPILTNSPDHKCATHHAGTQSDCKKGLEEYATHKLAKNKGKYTGQCANDHAYPSHPKH